MTLINERKPEDFDVVVKCGRCSKEVREIFSSYVAWPEGGGYSKIHLFCDNCGYPEEVITRDDD